MSNRMVSNVVIDSRLCLLLPPDFDRLAYLGGGLITR